MTFSARTGFSRRWMAWLVMLMTCAAGLSSRSAIAAYPERTVKVIVGFAPGGSNDILARIIAGKLQDKLKQSFIVENRAGANSIIAADFVSKAAPDGYTIFVASSGALTVNPGVYSTLSYDPVRDFQPVGMLGTFPLVVAVNASSPARKMTDLKAIAHGHPDGSLTHGVSSSVFQLIAELYAREAGLKLTHVNYKGTGPLVAALLGNQVDLGFIDIAAAVPSLKAGTLRALAVTTRKRSSVLPDVPTIAESGDPGYEASPWVGLVVPARTPPEVAKTLQKALKEILVDPDVARQFQQLGMEQGVLEGAAFGALIESDLKKWTALAKAAGIKAD